jgi:zinc/manganese transport system substrate-binding protein/manganese/iron transport system substrate-binding protein
MTPGRRVRRASGSAGRGARAALVGLCGLLGWLAAASTACGAPSASAPSSGVGPVRVLTSVSVLADLIEQVGGERVAVEALVPSGADPFTYQPAPREVLTAAAADLVLFNGLGLDRTVRSIAANSARTDLEVVNLADGLPTIEGAVVYDPWWSGEELAVRRPNPYLWMDPRLAAVYVERIGAALSRVDPGAASWYASNVSRYNATLAALEAEIESQLSLIPAEQRKLVTLHDGFPYFARRFGLEQVAIVIQTPGREPSAREVVNLATILRSKQVRTVFIEPQLNARLLKLAARDAGIEIRTLYSDTLDEHVPTYEALLRYNARQLVNGLR